MIVAIYARKWSAVVVLALVGLLLVVALAGAEDRTRVDLFDTNGKRTGYAIVDEKSGRVDLYDVNSRRTGWGRITTFGRIDLYNVNGVRRGTTVIPETYERYGDKKFHERRSE